MIIVQPIQEHSSYSFFEKILLIANPTHTIPGPHRDKLIEEMINIFNPLDHIMGIDDAAEKWNLSRSRVHKLCNEGKIPHKMISNAIILDRNQEYVRERAVKTKKIKGSESHEKN